MGVGEFDQQKYTVSATTPIALQRTYLVRIAVSISVLHREWDTM